MSHSPYLLLLGLISGFGWISWILVITRLDPEETPGSLPLVIFYATLFFALVGTLSILSFYIRIWLTKNELYFSHLTSAIKESIIFTCAIFTLMHLKYYNVLTIWDALLLLMAVVLLDVFFVTKKNNTF